MVGRKKRKREKNHPGHSPKWPQSSRLKPEAWCSIQVSHVNGRIPSTRAICCCLPRSMSREPGWR